MPSYFWGHLLNIPVVDLQSIEMGFTNQLESRNEVVVYTQNLFNSSINFPSSE